MNSIIIQRIHTTSWGLGRWLSQEGKGLYEGDVCLTKRDLRELPFPFSVLWGHREGRQAGWLAENQEADSHQTPNLLEECLDLEHRFQSRWRECACMPAASFVSDSLWPPWSCSPQAPLSMSLSGKILEWVVISSTLGDLPDPVESSLRQVDFFNCWTIISCYL